MLQFKNLSFKNKLILIIALTSTIVLLLASGAFVINDLRTFRQNLVNDLWMLADLVGANAAAPLMFDDTETAQQNIAALKTNKKIILTYIFKKNQSFVDYLRADENTKQFISHEEVLKLFSSNLTKDSHFGENYVGVYVPVYLSGNHIGGVYLQSDLSELDKRLVWARNATIAILGISITLSLLLAWEFQKIITTPLYRLVNTMRLVSKQKIYSMRETKTSMDEIGTLIDSFNGMLTEIEIRDIDLSQANQEISILNKRLSAENLRMGAELDVARQIQQMVLPRPQELQTIKGLDIVGFMQPAEEIGGDYYDVLQYNGRTLLAIGDVTGHGLESGVLMLMVQMAIRTLLVNEVQISELKTFLTTLNRAVYQNARRMDTDKNLTLCLLEYQQGIVRLSGQHEEVLVVRKDSTIERVNTRPLGFMAIGLKLDIAKFIKQIEIELQVGDGMVLYTDGITEAESPQGELYEIDKLCEVVSTHWSLSASEIQQAVVADVQRHLGEQNKNLDDITLVVFKRTEE
jgi:serine phosphatase RsbU (regulator of sigma subunit)